MWVAASILGWRRQLTSVEAALQLSDLVGCPLDLPVSMPPCHMLISCRGEVLVIRIWCLTHTNLSALCSCRRLHKQLGSDSVLPGWQWLRPEQCCEYLPLPGGWNAA